MQASLATNFTPIRTDEHNHQPAGLLYDPTAVASRRAAAAPFPVGGAYAVGGSHESETHSAALPSSDRSRGNHGKKSRSDDREALKSTSNNVSTSMLYTKSSAAYQSPLSSRQRAKSRAHTHIGEDENANSDAEPINPLAIDPNSFEVDDAARRSQLARLNTRASVPTSRPPPPKLPAGMDGTAGEALYRRLVDMRAMKATVAAWPVDEVEGLLLYCERLREEKLSAERQLAELHTNRALAAARGMITTTSFQDPNVADLLDSTTWGPGRSHSLSKVPSFCQFRRDQGSNSPSRRASVVAGDRDQYLRGERHQYPFPSAHSSHQASPTNSNVSWTPNEYMSHHQQRRQSVNLGGGISHLSQSPSDQRRPLSASPAYPPNDSAITSSGEDDRAFLMRNYRTL